MIQTISITGSMLYWQVT